MSTSAELVAMINARLAGAERLLASGSMLLDAEEHRLWRSSRDLWVGAAERDLADRVDEKVIHTFRRAVTPPPGEGSIVEDLPIELEAVRHGMAVLIGLRSQLQRDVEGPPPEADRRSARLGP